MSYQTTPAETVSLESLVQEFVERGAIALSLQTESISVTGSPYLLFRAYISPVVGRAINSQYDRVRVENKDFEFDVEPVPDVPDSFEGLPIYAEEGIDGVDSRPIEWGIRNVKMNLSSRIQNYLTERYRYGDTISGYKIIRDTVEPIHAGWDVTVGAEHENTGRQVWVSNTVEYDAYQISVFASESGEPLATVEFEELEVAFRKFDSLLEAEHPVLSSNEKLVMVCLPEDRRDLLREKQKTLNTLVERSENHNSNRSEFATVDDTVQWLCSIHEAQDHISRAERLNGRITGYLGGLFESTNVEAEFSKDKWESLQGESLVYALTSAIHQWQIIEDEEIGERTLANSASPQDIRLAVFENGYLFSGGKNPQLLYDPDKVSYVKELVERRDKVKERTNEAIVFPDGEGNVGSDSE